MPTIFSSRRGLLRWFQTLGLRGDKGDTGAGVVPGGTTGQVMVKASNTDYDTAWSSDLATALSDIATMQTQITDLTNRVSVLEGL